MNTTLVNPSFITATSKNKKEKQHFERGLIRSLAGNYRVDFKFAETFSPISEYNYQDRYFSAAKEVVVLLHDTADHISLQHILYVGPQVIKHWRQDWLYENTEILTLIEGQKWQKKQLSKEEVAGTWTQKVYQVDDAPRYEGLGTWVHVDGRHFWESTADAALPRREITQRNDYNVLRRHSHIEIFPDGRWIIEQDNEKINRTADGDILICWEKGMETFTPEDYNADFATNWWKDNQKFWSDVREIWSTIRSDRDRFEVEQDAVLYMAQHELSKRFSGEDYDQKEAVKAIKQLLDKHVSSL